MSLFCTCVQQLFARLCVAGMKLFPGYKSHSSHVLWDRHVFSRFTVNVSIAGRRKRQRVVSTKRLFVRSTLFLCGENIFSPSRPMLKDWKFDILCDKSMGVTSKHLVCVLLQNSVIVLEGDNLAFCLKPKHKFRFEHAWVTECSFQLKKCALNGSLKSNFIKVWTDTNVFILLEYWLSHVHSLTHPNTITLYHTFSDGSSHTLPSCASTAHAFQSCSPQHSMTLQTWLVSQQTSSSEEFKTVTPLPFYHSLYTK